MSTRNYTKIPGSILEYSFLNKTVQKDAGISAPSLKKTLAPSTLSQTKDAYLSNKTNFSSNLNKNTSRKDSTYRSSKVKSNKSFLQSSHSQPSFNLSMYEKEKERQIEHKKRIEEQRHLKNQLEMSQLRPYIKMSDNSRDIIRRKEKRNQSMELPFYLQDNKINEKDTMRLRNIIQKENEINQSETMNKASHKVFNKKKFDDFIKKNENMLIKKQKEVERLKKQIEIEEMSSECSFVPELNKRSLMMVNNQSYEENENRRMLRSRSYIKKEFTKIKEKNDYTPKTNRQLKNSKVKGNYHNLILMEKKNKNDIKGYKFKLNENKPINTTSNSNKTKTRNNETYTIKENKTERIVIKRKEVKVDDDPYNCLYKLNIRQNLPGQIPENVIKIKMENINNKNDTTNSILESFL